MSAGLRLYSRIQNLTRPASKLCYRPRPWIERADAIVNFNRGHASVNKSVFLFEHRRRCRLGIVLGVWLERAVQHTRERLDEQVGADVPEAATIRRHGIARTNSGVPA